jgi:hypothetical protein
MIKSIKDGYVIFEWEDGETHCLPIDVYNDFAMIHKLDLA